MLRAGRTFGQLAEQLRDEVPAFREELQQVAEDARRTFSRVEVAATVATATLVITAIVAVTALILGVGAVVYARRSPI